jgi:hypothetical protein
MREIKDAKLKDILNETIDKEPQPYANTYLGKENRKTLYTFESDPNKKKFQAYLRKALIDANTYMERNVQHDGFKKKKNKISKTILKRSKTLSDIYVENVNLDAAKKLKSFINNNTEAKGGKQDDRIDKLLALVTNMSKEMSSMKDRIKDRPIIGPELPTEKIPSLSQRFSDFLDAKAFEHYFAMIEKIADLVFGTATRVATGQNSKWLGVLKQVALQWIKTTLISIKQVLFNTLKVAKKLNGAFLSAVTLNWGGSVDYCCQLIADVAVLMASVSWIMINLNMIYVLVAAVEWFTETTLLTSYMSIAIAEIRNFFYSILVDASALPIRSVWYVARGVTQKGNFQTLVINGEGNARLWWFMRYAIDTVSVHVTTFFETLKASSEGMRLTISGFQSIFGVLQWVFTQITNLMASAAANAEWAAKQATVVAAQAAAAAARQLKNVPKMLDVGYKGVKELLAGIQAILPALGGGNPKLIAQYYDAMAVCSMLGISVVELKEMKNEPVVSYVLKNNSMTRLETFFVLCQLSKEVEPKEVLLLEDKPKLKF